MTAFLDITGRRFGRLIAHSRVPGTPVRWLCVCDCGGRKIVPSSQLTRGQTRSCGCLWNETRAKGRILAQKAGTRHGLTRKGAVHPLFVAWAGMIARCTNPKHSGYRWYGARGVTVCDRWRDFAAFVADVGERPAGKTLDRIDPNGNYEPGNVRWATHKEQRANQRAKGAA